MSASATMAGGSTPVRLMLASISCEKGDWQANLAAHVEVMRQASGEGCQLAVFPEMSLSGSVDPAEHPDALLRIDSDAVQSVVDSTQQHSVGAIFGIAERADDGNSHITQIYASQGRLMGAYRKRRLGEGEEGFTPGAATGIFSYGALKFGIAICSEGKVDYPFDEPRTAGAAILFFCAAPGLHCRRTDDRSWREGHLWWESEGLVQARRHASRTGAWIALVTQAGSTVDEDFPGLAALVSPEGEVVDRLPDWREGLLTVDVPLAFEVQPVREAARVLVLDEDDRALLVQFSDDFGHTWWAAPGGGLQPGEDHASAALRELEEELGTADIELGPEIGWRRHTLSFNANPWMTQHERWFVARHASFDVPAEQVASLASEAVTDARWWSADQLAGSGLVTAPRGLAALIRRAASGDLPTAGTDLGV
ncbi:MAG: nitrilase-related carbon-nitrogen hydrolase [Acidimicrobiales bacterium]